MVLWRKPPKMAFKNSIHFVTDGSFTADGGVWQLSSTHVGNGGTAPIVGGTRGSSSESHRILERGPGFSTSLTHSSVDGGDSSVRVGGLSHPNAGHPTQDTDHLTMFATADGIADDCSWMNYCHSFAAVDNNWEILATFGSCPATMAA